MLPERIPNPRVEPGWTLEVCRVAGRWHVDAELIYRIANAQKELPFDLHIFSGARTRATQKRVSSTPFEVSTHADQDTDGCPRLATGADVQPVSPGVRRVGSAVAQMGAAFTLQGLRWGGGAPVGDDGIPVGNERWHVDLGPRRPP